MKLFLILITLMVTTCVFSKDFTRGKGKFKATDDDSYEFIKKQLLHQGFKDIITKELTTSGLNATLFWQKYNEKLSEVYQQIDADLRLKYQIDEKPSAAQRQAYAKTLRKKKLVRERSFGGINNIIPRWVVKKISRSQKYPRNRYIQIEGQVDTAKLNKVYYSFMRGKQSLVDGALYLRVNFDFSGFNYSDIGIENEKDFDDIIAKKWLEWFMANKPANISNVMLVDEGVEQQLKSLGTAGAESFDNALLLDINLVLTQLDANKELNIYEFAYNGYGYLKNLQSNIVVETYKINREEKQYRLPKKSNIANIVANYVYQLAKGYFPKVNRDVSNVAPVTSSQRISMFGFENIGEVDELLTLIRTRGVKYSLKTEIASISQDRAEVIFYYDGKMEQIKSLLSELKSAKKDLSFELVDTIDVFGIKLKHDTTGEKI